MPGSHHLLQEDHLHLRAGGEQPVPALHDVRHRLRSEQLDRGRRDREPESSWNRFPVVVQGDDDAGHLPDTVVKLLQRLHQPLASL